jgi:hypothetical protein
VEKTSSGWPPPERITLTCARGQGLEVGQLGQVGSEGRLLADNEAGKLDEQLGLVGEVGDLLAARAVVMPMAGVGCRRMAAVAAILGVATVALQAAGSDGKGR